MAEADMIDGREAEIERLRGEQSRLENMDRYRRESLIALAGVVMPSRQEAISARQSSGVEERWLDDMDQYYGIDAVNRPLMLSQTLLGARRAERNASNQTSAEQREPRSTVFVQVTRQRTDAAVARLADMLYPTDEKNWEIQPTPVPEYDDLRRKGGNSYVPGPDGVTPLAHPARPGQAMEKPLMVSEVVDEMYEEAERAAELMTQEIDDQLTEGNYNAEGRTVIEDAGMLGTGILKGPVVVNRISKRWEPVTDPKTGQKTRELVIKEDQRPTSERKDPWNIYPDAACGEDPQDGGYVWERDEVPGKYLRELMATGTYFDDEIRECLRQGPMQFVPLRTNQGGKPAMAGDMHAYRRGVFELWTFTGEVEVRHLRRCGCDVDGDSSGEEQDDSVSEPIEQGEAIPRETRAEEGDSPATKKPRKDDYDTVSAIIVICNDRVIKVALNPMDGGDLPYDFFVWSKVRGSPWGLGIPHMIKHAQSALNAGWRTMIDNAGVSHGPQIVISEEKIRPADGQRQVSGRKLWYANDDVDDVQKAFYVFDVENRMGDLQLLVDLSMKWIDEESGMSMLAQGEMGEVPDKVGVANILMNASNVITRRLAKQHDDRITTPHIRRYYDYSMQYSDREEIKGDNQIWARGSTALMQRDQHGQMMQVLAAQSGHPVFGIYLDPQKILKMQVESARIPWSSVSRSDSEVEKLLEIQQKQAEAGAQEPGQERIQVAKINAEANLQRAQMEAQSKQANIELEAAKEAANDERDTTALLAEMDARAHEMSLQTGVEVSKIKAGLAQAAMQAKATNKPDRYQAAIQAAKTAPRNQPRAAH